MISKMTSHIITSIYNQIKKLESHLKKAVRIKRESINLKGELEKCNCMLQKYNSIHKFKNKIHNHFQDKVNNIILHRSNLMIIISMMNVNC